MNTDAMMIYKCGRDTIHALDKFDEVIDFLKTVGSCRPVTPREIGCFAYGEDYFFTEYGQKKVDKAKSSHLGQMLRHLRKQKLVESVVIDGKPIEVEVEDYIYDHPYTVPRTIEAYDKNGKFIGIIDNPAWNSRDAIKGQTGHWGRVTKTIIPKITAYKWVG